MSTYTPSPNRLRPHPAERFAAEHDRVDLYQAAEMLEHEDSGQHGHRQIALFKHGPATVALFTFEAGARLADHVIDGPVILQALAGHMRVTTEDAGYELNEGQLLRLAPGVRHDIAANLDSRLLMTICVEGPNSHA